MLPDSMDWTALRVRLGRLVRPGQRGLRALRVRLGRPALTGLLGRLGRPGLTALPVQLALQELPALRVLSLIHILRE